VVTEGGMTAAPESGGTEPEPRHPSLENEAGLWERWRRDGDAAARDAIARHYISYSRALAARIYARRARDEFDFEEYAQLATVGLMESVDRFDPGRGVQFKSYATHRIVGAILSGLTSLSERQQQIQLRRRIAHERVESLREAAADAASPEDQLRALAEIGVGLALGIILEGTGMIHDEEGAAPDNTYTGVELRQFRDGLAQAIERLTERERDVIRLHYLQGLAFGDIARDLGLTQGRVSQLNRQGLSRLRRLLREADRGNVTL
jgi:RNA polymerase sigma factor for flagellar operon FliA